MTRIGQAIIAAAMMAVFFVPLAARAEIAFSSPSGNIICYRPEAAAISCLILDRNWSDDQLAALQSDHDGECPVDRTAAIALPANGPPRLIEHCHGDAFWWTENQFVLPYGFSVQNSEFNCTSEKSGMTCRNRLGHGFTMARAQYRILSP